MRLVAFIGLECHVSLLFCACAEPLQPQPQPPSRVQPMSRCPPWHAFPRSVAGTMCRRPSSASPSWQAFQRYLVSSVMAGASAMSGEIAIEPVHNASDVPNYTFQVLGSVLAQQILNYFFDLVPVATFTFFAVFSQSQKLCSSPRRVSMRRVAATHPPCRSKSLPAWISPPWLLMPTRSRRLGSTSASSQSRSTSR